MIAPDLNSVRSIRLKVKHSLEKYISGIACVILLIAIAHDLNLNLLLCRRNIFPEGELSALN